MSPRRSNEAPGIGSEQFGPVSSEQLNCGLCVDMGRQRLQQTLLQSLRFCESLTVRGVCSTASSYSQGPEGASRGGSVCPQKDDGMVSRDCAVSGQWSLLVFLLPSRDEVVCTQLLGRRPHGHHVAGGGGSELNFPPRIGLTTSAEGSLRRGQIDLLLLCSVGGSFGTDRLHYSASCGVAASLVGCPARRTTGIQDGRPD